MANTNVSDVANSVGLGDNKQQGGVLGDTGMKAGWVVYQHDADTFKTFVSGASEDPLGILREIYYTGLDATQTSGSEAQVYTEGYCAAYVSGYEAAQAGRKVYAGDPDAPDGYLSIKKPSSDDVNLSGAFVMASGIQFGRLARGISQDDMVGIVKIDR